MRYVVSIVLSLIASAAFADPITLTPEGLELHRKSLVVDGHNDLPWAIRTGGGLERFDLSGIVRSFNTDIPRLREGGVGAQFWSVYVPVQTMNTRNAYSTTVQQINLVHRMVQTYANDFAIALSTADIRAARAAGKIASMIGMEGGHSIEESIPKLRDLYARGARYMTLTHSRSLSWADSANDRRVVGGLNDFGRSVVREMNKLGMLVDISHVSPAAMHDAIATSVAPVIFSHSSAYGVLANPRNVPDDVLREMPRNGGIVMVNFYSDYIVSSGRGDVDSILDHIDHIVEVAGIDHVGLGSDFDGVPTLPVQMEDVAKYPYITQGLINRGYTEAEIQKILGENLMRVFELAEKVAGKHDKVGRIAR